MKKYPAMGLLEFRDVSAGMHATDAMVKKSPIAFLKCGIISRGRYLTLIGGSTAAVDEAFGEGLFWGKDSLVDHVLLPDVHPQVHDAILGRRAMPRDGAMAIIETPTVSSNVRAAELALKGVPIDLVEISLADAWLSGKGISIYRGELYDIEAAVEIATSFLRQAGVQVMHRIIAAPHESFCRQVESGTFFSSTGTLNLEGEES